MSNYLEKMFDKNRDPNSFDTPVCQNNWQKAERQSRTKELLEEGKGKVRRIDERYTRVQVLSDQAGKEQQA